jgi:hypothetical protein
MLEALALTLLKTVATTCVKFYLGTLLGSGHGLDYKRSDLGYDVPKWFMNPDKGEELLLGYGTSVVGDEFESLADAREKAIDQMAETIRVSSRAMIQDQVKYDKSSVKQQRLVELFARNDGIVDFIRASAEMDKKQLVKVTQPERDMRAFVRIRLAPSVYIKHQEGRIKALKTKIVQQKTDDLMAELEAEVAASSNKPPAEVSVPEVPAPAPQDTPKVTPRSSGKFSDLEKELDSSSK